MRDEFKRTIERLRQAARSDQRAGAGTPAATPTTSGVAADLFAAGGRVFDTQTGEEGIVLGRTTENVIVSTTK